MSGSLRSPNCVLTDLPGLPDGIGPRERTHQMASASTPLQASQIALIKRMGRRRQKRRKKLRVIRRYGFSRRNSAALPGMRSLACPVIMKPWRSAVSRAFVNLTPLRTMSVDFDATFLRPTVSRRRAQVRMGYGPRENR